MHEADSSEDVTLKIDSRRIDALLVNHYFLQFDTIWKDVKESLNEKDSNSNLFFVVVVFFESFKPEYLCSVVLLVKIYIGEKKKEVKDY